MIIHCLHLKLILPSNIEHQISRTFQLDQEQNHTFQTSSDTFFWVTILWRHTRTTELSQAVIYIPKCMVTTVCELYNINQIKYQHARHDLIGCLNYFGMHATNGYFDI